MAFKITFGEKISGIIALFTNKQTEVTLSYSPKKKFSDIVEYVRSGKFGKSLAGRAVRDTDSGYLFEYEYYNDGKSTSKGGYKVTVSHVGEKVNELKLRYRNPGAALTAKDILNKLDKVLPDYVAPTGQEEVVSAIDYSAKTLSELVDTFDKNLQEFKKNPTISALNDLDNINKAMSNKVGEKPLAERGAFEKPISNITMYIDALKMQMSSAMANPTQFVNMYAPQMSSALSELAKLV